MAYKRTTRGAPASKAAAAKRKTPSLTVKEKALLQQPDELAALEKLEKIRKLKLENDEREGKTQLVSETEHKALLMYQVGRTYRDSAIGTWRARFGDKFDAEMQRFLLEYLDMLMEDIRDAGRKR